MSARQAKILPDGSWSMLPKFVVESGALRDMTQAQCRVYIALDLRTHWGTDKTAIVSQEQLEQDTGIKARNIRRAIYGAKNNKTKKETSGLVQLGVVQVISIGCGRGKASVYKIITQNPDVSAPLSNSKTRTLGDTKPGRTEHKRRTLGALKADACAPPIEGKESKEGERRRATGVASGQEEEDQSQTVQRLMNASRKGDRHD